MNCLLFGRLGTELSVSYMGVMRQKQRLIACKALRQLNTTKSSVFAANPYLQREKTNQTLSERLTTIRSISTSTEFNLLVNGLNDNFLVQKRYKKGKKGPKRAAQESTDDESDAEEEEVDSDLIDGKAIGFTDANVTLVSLRLDNVLKSGLNMARTRVDEAFYDHLIRVNGERVSKKSAELAEHDEIDLIRGINEDNEALIDVSRVVVKKIEDKLSSKDRIKATLRRFKTLTIENYPKDPYDGYVVNISRKGREESDDKEQ